MKIVEWVSRIMVICVRSWLLVGVCFFFINTYTLGHTVNVMYSVFSLALCLFHVNVHREHETQQTHRKGEKSAQNLTRLLVLLTLSFKFQRLQKNKSQVPELFVLSVRNVVVN